MGQNSSNLLNDFPNLIPETLNLNLKAQVLQEIVNLTREDLTKYIEEMNELSHSCLSSNGHQMLFTVKKDTDTPFYWKVSIRICCVKFMPATKRIETLTLINLRQFMSLFRNCQSNLETMISSQISIDQSLLDSCSLSSVEVDTEECCICLDRKPDVILPCLHLFCGECIAQWNENNKTCPICQEKLETTDDSWIMAEMPEAGEISREIQDSLLNISVMKES